MSPCPSDNATDPLDGLVAGRPTTARSGTDGGKFAYEVWGLAPCWRHAKRQRLIGRHGRNRVWLNRVANLVWNRFAPLAPDFNVCAQNFVDFRGCARVGVCVFVAVLLCVWVVPDRRTALRRLANPFLAQISVSVVSQPRRVGSKIHTFFSSPATISLFLSLSGCLVEFWWCLKRRPKLGFGSLGFGLFGLRKFGQNTKKPPLLNPQEPTASMENPLKKLQNLSENPSNLSQKPKQFAKRFVFDFAQLDMCVCVCVRLVHVLLVASSGQLRVVHHALDDDDTDGRNRLWPNRLWPSLSAFFFLAKPTLAKLT